MTEKQFDREIARLLRRLQLLKAGKAGDVPFRKVWRNGYKVKAHEVQGHYMHIAGKKS